MQQCVLSMLPYVRISGLGPERVTTSEMTVSVKNIYTHTQHIRVFSVKF